MTPTPEAIAAIVSVACRRMLLAVLLVVVPLDGRDTCSARAQLRQVASLVLEASLADDVELAILAVRTIDQPGQRRALECGEMLAGQVSHQIGRRKDRLAIDQLQTTLLPMRSSLAASRDSSRVAPALRRCVHNLACEWPARSCSPPF